MFHYIDSFGLSFECLDFDTLKCVFPLTQVSTSNKHILVNLKPNKIKFDILSSQSTLFWLGGCSTYLKYNPVDWKFGIKTLGYILKTQIPLDVSPLSCFRHFFKVMNNLPENWDFSIFCSNLMKNLSLDVYNDKPDAV